MLSAFSTAFMSGTIRKLAAGAAIAALAAGGAAAQGNRRGFRFRGPTIRMATPEDFDCNFLFCRLIFRNASNGDGNGWGVDYPRADINLTFRLSELTTTTVSRDPEVVKDYDSDPLNYHGKLPARTVSEISRTIETFPEAVTHFKLPLLVMHGTADRLVPIAGCELVAERAGSEDKTFKRYDGLFHEILNEPERQQVLNDMADWLDAHFPA